MSYDRYSRFRANGKIGIVPAVTIPTKTTDYYEIYERGRTRLDNVSYTYYGDANYDWLIMMANPQYGSLEYEIPNGAQLRIPYPLSTTLEQYENALSQYNTLYGIE